MSELDTLVYTILAIIAFILALLFQAIADQVEEATREDDDIDEQ